MLACRRLQPPALKRKPIFGDLAAPSGTRALPGRARQEFFRSLLEAKPSVAGEQFTTANDRR
jgi:hypothetical protein